MHKTRVHRIARGVWRVDYYLPYSGMLFVKTSTWAEAMVEAWHVEEIRPWV